MVLLTEKERQMLRQASSGLTGVEFARLPHTSRSQYTDDLKEVVNALFKNHPEAFIVRAVNQWKEKQRNYQTFNRAGEHHGE